jgi:hypothetical protein
MKGRVLWMGPILVTLLAVSCSHRPTMPSFRIEPCPDIPFYPFEASPDSLRELEETPIIPADTQGGIANFVVRMGNLRWGYEIPPWSRSDIPTRSECPWLFYDWEYRRTTAEEAQHYSFFLIGWETQPSKLETRLYVAKVRSFGIFLEPIVAGECEFWDPDPNRTGEIGEGERCRRAVHIRPEWEPRWMVIFAVRRGVAFVLLPIPFKDMRPVARLEIPPLPQR